MADAPEYIGRLYDARFPTLESLVAHAAGGRIEFGVAKAAADGLGADGLGAKHLSEELLDPMGLVIKTDAAAAKGLIQRQGAGRVKHLSVKQLWVQERESAGELEIVKILRAINIADLLTHHLSETEGRVLLGLMSVERRGASFAVPARGSHGNLTSREAFVE